MTLLNILFYEWKIARVYFIIQKSKTYLHLNNDK
jgi:hypothetical protein